jgi:Uma2 family endonuclease
MATATLVSVEEYLTTSYPDGDREYIDGRIVELGMTDVDHSHVQTQVPIYLAKHYPEFWSGTAVRVQVTSTRFRVPDVAVVLGGRPKTRIIQEPPLLVVEIVSPDDRVETLEEKLHEYFAFGIPYVWEINPRTRRGYIHTPGTRKEATDGVLRIAEPEIAVPLSAVL